jgi:hypothetical protein
VEKIEPQASRSFMRWKLFCLGLTLIVPMVHSAAAASVAIQPSKDNTLIQQTNPASQLSNGQGDIFVGRTNQDGPGATIATISTRRGLEAFDVAGNVPAGATITGVTLTMRDVMGLNGDPSVELHRLLQDWGEGASFQSGGMGAAAQNGDATWLYTFFNFASPGSSPTWSTPGGNFSATVSASAVIFDDLGGGQLFSWSSASNPLMITDVQFWLDNPAANFGWLLKDNEALGQTAKRFNSGESTLSPNVPPVLTITYIVPEPPGLALCAIVAISMALTGRTVRRPT